MSLHKAEILVWRHQINPLRGLTITRVSSMLENHIRGYYADLQWLYSFIERRDATLRACVVRRSAALGKLDWQIKIKEEIENGTDAAAKAAAEEQRVALKQAYQGIDNLKEAIAFLGLAEFRGFSHLEKHYTPDGDVIHLEPVEQWYWTKRYPVNRWLYNASAENIARGVEIDYGDFIIRECKYPINEVGVLAFMRKNLCDKDWDAFIETYGIPPMFAILPENANNSDEYQQMCESVIADARGVLPNGADIKSIGTEARGQKVPFKERYDHLDQQVVMAATGGKLTMLNDATGLGSGQSEAHESTFDEIAVSEAMQISEIFQKQFDAAFLQQNFPEQEALVYFELSAKEEDDIDQLTEVVSKLHAAGFRTDAGEISERVGLKLEDTYEEQMEMQRQQLQAGAGIGDEDNEDAQRSDEEKALENRRGSGGENIIDETREALTEAVFSDIEVYKARLDKILDIEDDELRNRKLREFRGDLAKVLRDLNRDPKSAAILEEGMLAAFINGAEAATK